MRNVLLLLLSITIFACSSPVKSPALEPGISWELAQFRKTNLENVAYQLHFDIPKNNENPIPASVNISFDLLNEIDQLPIDFNEAAKKVKTVTANGESIEVVHEKEHIIVSGKFLQLGNNAIKIEFEAGERSLNRSEDFLYTLLVPDRASTLFPSFDQPNMKAKYTLSLTIPEAWEAMGNGPLRSETTENGRKTIRYKETEKIPTYLFSFVAGNFQSVTNTDGGRAMTMLHRESDSAKVTRNIPEIFKLHRQALNWLEDYTGIIYPYQKFDFALIPPFQYGGMEHVGAIQYRASSLMQDENASQQQLLGRASLIAHETAHMWFGDLVTMNWFDDVWMKEVFANFMAAKIVNPAFPELNHNLRFLLAHHPAAMSVDRTEGRHPIQQELENLKQAGNLYGPIIYQKAPIMMRQLEAKLGEDKFQIALQKYLLTFGHGNATWDDLVEILDEQSDEDIKLWSELWVKDAIFPKIEIKQENGQLIVNHPDGKFLPQIFTVALINAGKREDITVDIQNANFSIPLSQEYSYIIPNADGMGYGYFPLSDESISLIPALEDPILRASAYLNLYESVLNNEYSPIQAITIFKEGLTVETEQQITSRLLGMVSSIYWRYLRESEREEIATEWESFILDKWESTETQGDKSTWYSSYIGMAISEAAAKNIEKWWREEKPVLGLSLSESNVTSLAAAIALREVEATEEILAKQPERIKNPDNRKRFEFVSQALSPNIEVRNAFFESLKNAENRQYEPWVTQAMGYLNHPSRQTQGLEYLPEALLLLEEIQITGDIFFPKAWLDASFSGHNSKEAADIIRQFLADHPDFNPRLKQKLLQAADPVFRAEAILWKKEIEK